MDEVPPILESSINDEPDKYFTNSCSWYNGPAMYEYLTGTGWTCWNTRTLDTNCRNAGNPLV
ncbi:hypothetical protein HDU96_002956 [Phlyctochytrium bullatum]|nr:hypothetical protein HDU96_002956 [Phlyctochytrium bullatum]